MTINLPPTTTGRHQPSSIRNRILDHIWPDQGEAIDGSVSVTPRAIDYTGTSAFVAGNGSIIFDSVGTLTLYELFTADYDNYVFSINARLENGTANRFRYILLSGNQATPTQAVSAYNKQMLTVNNTAVGGERTTGLVAGEIGSIDLTNGSWDLTVHRPFVSSAHTLTRSVGAESFTNAYITDIASIYTVAQSHTGIIFNNNNGALMTGSMSIVGLRK